MTATAVAAYLGILLAGCTAALIADSFAVPEVAARLRIAGARAIITQARCQGSARPCNQGSAGLCMSGSPSMQWLACMQWLASLPTCQATLHPCRTWCCGKAAHCPCTRAWRRPRRRWPSCCRRLAASCRWGILTLHHMQATGAALMGGSSCAAACRQPPAHHCMRVVTRRLTCGPGTSAGRRSWRARRRPPQCTRTRRPATTQPASCSPQAPAATPRPSPGPTPRRCAAPPMHTFTRTCGGATWCAGPPTWDGCWGPGSCLEVRCGSGVASCVAWPLCVALAASHALCAGQRRTCLKPSALRPPLAALLNGATIALLHGSPQGRPFGQFVAAAGVTMLGTVPSLVKASWCEQSGVALEARWSQKDLTGACLLAGSRGGLASNCAAPTTPDPLRRAGVPAGAWQGWLGARCAASAPRARRRRPTMCCG